MKTIIISDVNSKWETVIPYGLRVGRAFESEVDVIYVIDSREHQGEYTPYSDSQSITPGGNTLSQKEIVQRERNKANLALDNVLSSETSRLNYPLKVNRVIKENSIVDELTQLAKENPDYLFVISAEPDHYNFESKDDIISALQEAGVAALLVPPRKDFKDFKKVLLPVDFRSEKFEAYRDVKFIFDRFKPLVDAVTVVADDSYAEMEMKGEGWKKTANEYFIETSLKTHTIKGEQFTPAIIDYVERNNQDLIMVFQDKRNEPKQVFTKQDIITLLNDLEIPVLLYYHKK